MVLMLRSKEKEACSCPVSICTILAHTDSRSKHILALRIQGSSVTRNQRSGKEKTATRVAQRRVRIDVRTGFAGLTSISERIAGFPRPIEILEYRAAARDEGGADASYTVAVYFRRRAEATTGGER